MTHSKQGGGLIKAETGIQGFDAISGGGLPAGRTTLLMGGPGSGKTVFALQALLAGVRRGEPGIFVTFQESPRQLMENAASFGWNLAELDKLVILDSRIRPNVFKSIELYLTGMLAGTRVVAAEMGAKNIVFDSIDVLFSLLPDRISERLGIFRLRDWLLENDLTAILTAQTEREETSAFQRHGQFSADCVIHLQQRLASEKTTRGLRVSKYRGSAFVEREILFGIGASGIEMASPAQKDEPQVKEAAVSLKRDIATSQAVFKARIQSLTQQLETKQSELNFLKEKARAASKAGLRNGRAVSKNGKTMRKALAASARRTSQQMARKEA